MANAPVVPIQLPQIGNTMEEGTILSWKVGVGDEIRVGDVIFEMETDKAAVEVESAAGGRLARIVVQEGELAAVLTAVAYLGESDEAVEEYIKEHGADEGESKEQLSTINYQLSSDNKQQVEAGTVTREEGGRQKVSPAARKLAGERGIEIGAVGAGSGPGGRVTTSDVEKAASAVRGAATTGGKRREMTPMRRAIAQGLQMSKQTIPHFYMERTIDAEPLMRFCKERREKACTMNDVIVYACGRAVGEFAEFRSRLEGREIVEVEGSNIGVAVQTERGLMVPVVKGVEKRSLEESAQETHRVIEAARNGKLVGVGEGVFTVSNLGMMGVDRFSAIINPPEAAILAVGSAREEAVVREGTIGVGKRMSLTLSCDHRLIDGVLAAKFLARLKAMLERPEGLEGK